MSFDTVLIIDDNIEFLADVMPFLINEMKIKVTLSFSREEAEKKIRKDNPGIIILDLGLNGCEKLSALRDLRFDAPIILTTSDCDNDDYPELSKELGSDAYCLKSRFRSAFPKLLKYLETGLNFPSFRKELCLMK
jgi:DNA-binding NarL/FixJ family response regulator